ncbi:SGNH/GDSL hydrolase family protein [Microvirga flavescens]|uniref:SGNH/GDSL hydrolase family protein n=1 Tax=Microvirga flavescens TaxID=2249811 RepID=UPI000DDB7499|nr:SGNH family hydrolase [Microvirga flavescens]
MPLKLWPLLRLMPVLTGCAFIALGAAPSNAQTYGYPQQRSPYGAPPSPGRRDLRAYPPGYYPGKLVQPAPQQGFSLRRFFGIPDEPPPQPLVVRPARPKPAPTTVVHQEKVKPNAATHIVVFGDALAAFASQGIDAVYAESEDVAVIRKTRNESGLARAAADEWPKFIRETLDGGQKITLAVVMIGVNDHAPIKDGNETYEPLSDRWRDIYRQRADGIVRAFKERGIPFIWIGLPPMRSDKLSEDLMAMNEIFREATERLGGDYVDIWQGFVDEDNRFTMAGPDVDGQPAKLRTNDGVLFTNAGARKLAHFADMEIKNLLEQHAATGMAARPDDGMQGPIVPTPETADIPALPSKPLIGPVLPLTRPDLAQGGTLVSSPPRLQGERASPIQRSLREGAPSSPPPGRLDDFRWPPS